MIPALLSGILLGIFMTRKQSQLFNILYVMYPFRKREGYEDLYELCDGEYSFELSQSSELGPKTYHEFLLRHEKGREIAYDTFITLYRAIGKILLRNYGIIIVLSLIIFRSNSLLFLKPFIACHIAYQIYLYYYKENKIDFNAIFIHNMIICDEKVRIVSEQAPEIE